MSDLELEPASFRDPASTVAYLDGRVLRGLTKEGAADFDTLAAAPFFDKAMDDGKLVRTTQVPVEDLPQSVRGDAWVRALEHERIPFVSYPYEWTFSMLKDAALVHLDLLLSALGADLTMPERGEKVPKRARAPLRVSDAQVKRLEDEIDAMNAELAPLRSFVLPGGSAAAAALHVARTVCRRAERGIVELAGLPNEPVGAAALKYVNRLSDHLFVASRYVNARGEGDVLWVPGQNR